MPRSMAIGLLISVLSAAAASAQQQSNLAMPYRFRLPFLAKGEYVVSAVGGNISNRYNYRFADSLAQSTIDNNSSWFDLNGVAALSDQFLVSAALTVYPQRTTTEYDLSPGGTVRAFHYEDKVKTHVAPDITVVWRPIQRFEVFASYFNFAPEWTRTSSDNNPLNVVSYDQDYWNFRGGVTYFGKF